jgi:hypothetical protein
LLFPILIIGSLGACKEITSLFKVHSFVKNLSKDIISLILIFFLKF